MKTLLTSLLCLLPAYTHAGSIPPTYWSSVADLNADGTVNWFDLMTFCSQWLTKRISLPADLNGDDQIDMKDFATFARDWGMYDIYLHNGVTNALSFAASRLQATTATVSTTSYPVYTSSYTAWVVSDASGWTSGFFPGSLWLLYEADNQPSFLRWAQNWTAGLQQQALNTTTNDVGFMIFSSFGNGYRLTENASYKNTSLTAAQSLSTLYNPVVGCVESATNTSWHFPVNIDTMMNLELLFWASANGGSASWYQMAYSHANHVRRDLVRPDGSTYQFVDYNPANGSIISKFTRQGYSTDSTWSRGQGWAVYGFTTAYRYTGEPNFLQTAEHVADYFIDNSPADGVPYWDFQAPGIPNTARDSSAAAVAASGLLDLSTMVTGIAQKQRYYYAACHTLTSLCTSNTSGGYLATDEHGNAISPGIIMHGCYVDPDSVIGGNISDTSLSWGDYYFLKALLQYKAISMN